MDIEDSIKADKFDSDRKLYKRVFGLVINTPMVSLREALKDELSCTPKYWTLEEIIGLIEASWTAELGEKEST